MLFRRRPDCPDKLFADVTLAQLAAQMEQIDSLDQKAATAFTFGSVVLPVYAALIALKPSNHIPNSAVIALALAGLAYVALAAFSLLAYWIRSFSFRPHPDDLADRARQWDEPRLYRWIARNQAASLEHNRKLIQRKARYLHGSLLALALLAFFLTLSALLTLVL